MASKADGAVPALSLAEAWLVAISEGRLSIADAADWAGARMQEGGVCDPKMLALAHCTADAERKLHTWVSCQPWRRVLPQPYTFKAPVATLAGVDMKVQHCLLPHEVLSCLADQAPRVFEELFGTPSDQAHFW